MYSHWYASRLQLSPHNSKWRVRLRLDVHRLARMNGEAWALGSRATATCGGERAGATIPPATVPADLGERQVVPAAASSALQPRAQLREQRQPVDAIVSRKPNSCGRSPVYNYSALARCSWFVGQSLRSAGWQGQAGEATAAPPQHSAPSQEYSPRNVPRLAALVALLCRVVARREAVARQVVVPVAPAGISARPVDPCPMSESSGMGAGNRPERATGQRYAEKSGMSGSGRRADRTGEWDCRRISLDSSGQDGQARCPLQPARPLPTSPNALARTRIRIRARRRPRHPRPVAPSPPRPRHLHPSSERRTPSTH